MAKFDLNDSGVVVIVGSGAGGGTLGNELAQKGVKVVILEAGSRIELQDFVNDEWESFTPARLDRHAHHLGKLARRQGFSESSGMDREGGRRFDDALGRRLAALRRARVQGQEHLWRHRRRQSPGLADHARRNGAVVRQGRGQDGRHPHQRHRGSARQQQFQGAGSRREEARLQGSAHRQHGDQQRPARRPRRLPADRLLLPGLQVGREMVDALYRDPQGRGDRQSRGSSQQHGDQDRARRVRQGDRRGLCRRERCDAAPEGARGRGRGQLDREPAAVAQQRLEPVPERPRQLVRSGRPQLHAAHDRQRVCRIREISAHVSRHHHGRHHPRRIEEQSRSAASSAATRWRRCRSAFPSWRRS